MTTSIISDPDSLDLIAMMQDSLDIALDCGCDHDDHDHGVSNFAFSESVKPPAYMASSAKKGLKLRDKQPDSNKCCTPTGLARANQIADRENLSLRTVKRIKSFASRHGANLKANTESDSKLVQSLLLWGIPASKSGVQRVIRWADAQIKKLEKKED